MKAPAMAASAAMIKNIGLAFITAFNAFMANVPKLVATAAAFCAVLMAVVATALPVVTAVFSTMNAF